MDCFWVGYSFVTALRFSVEDENMGLSCARLKYFGNALLPRVWIFRQSTVLTRCIQSGSWGSSLSLAYAQMYPERCLGLVLRGIFTLRREELLWFYQKGADMLFPDYFDAYKAVIPAEERGDLMNAYYRRLTGGNEEEKLKW